MACKTHHDVSLRLTPRKGIPPPPPSLDTSTPARSPGGVQTEHINPERHHVPAFHYPERIDYVAMVGLFFDSPDAKSMHDFDHNSLYLLLESERQLLAWFLKINGKEYCFIQRYFIN